MNNPYKPSFVDSQLAILDSQIQSGLRGPVGTSGLGDELEGLCRQGQLSQAVNLLLSIGTEGTPPSVIMYRSSLKACAERKALAHVKQIHAYLEKHGLETTRYLGEYIVSTYVKCGSNLDALQLFNRLPCRTALSWTAVIAGCSASGQNHDALNMYCQMQEQGVEPSAYTFVPLLKACSSLADLEMGKQIHADILKYCCESDLFVCTGLIEMYGMCGSLVDAEKVFYALTQKDVVVWNAMFGAYTQHGQAKEVVHLFDHMQAESVRPDARTFVSVIQAFSILAENEVHMDGQAARRSMLDIGRAIHAEAQNLGCCSDVVLGNTLITMYKRCGSIVDARDVFDGLSLRDSMSWTVMLAAYVEQGDAHTALELYEKMCVEKITPTTNRIFVIMLQSCAILAEKEERVVVCGRVVKVMAVERGKRIYADAWKHGYGSDLFVVNTLMHMFGKWGCIVEAQHLFDGLSTKDVVSWTAMLGAHVELEQFDEAWQLYEEMLESGVSPNDRTFVTALKACSLLADREEHCFVDGRPLKLMSLGKGRTIYADVRSRGYDSDIFVAGALVTLFGKFGSPSDAWNVFDELSQRDLVVWSAMLVAFAECGDEGKVLDLYERMREEGVSLNERTFVCVLRACSMLGEREEEAALDGQFVKMKSLDKGRALHADAWRMGFDSDVFVASALISMYGTCGSISDAQNVFDAVSQQNLVVWTAMLAAYARHGQPEKALQLYKQLAENGVALDDVVVLCALHVCSISGALSTCREIHHSLVSSRKHITDVLASSLIHAYGRCGSMVDAQAVFNGLLQPDVVSWTALMAGYARQGNCAATLQCYKDMELAGVQPNAVTFLSLMSACSHAGLVDKGVAYFESMVRDHGIPAEMEHYSTMVDLLGRAGHVEEALALLTALPVQPDLATWSCLLGACRKHGQIPLGKQAFQTAIRTGPLHSAPYLLMSNMYADAELWDGSKEVTELRLKEGAWKKAGRSWLEYEHDLQTFVVEDIEKQHEGQESQLHLHHLLQKVSGHLEDDGCASQHHAWPGHHAWRGHPLRTNLKLPCPPGHPATPAAL